MTTPLPRDQFPVTERHVFLDHAGVAPLSRSCADAMRQAIDDFLHEGSFVADHYDEVHEEVRAKAATLLGVPTDDVAFVKNTTEGLAFVAEGLGLVAGDRVLVPDGEFPSTLYPWLAQRDRGVVVDLLSPDPATGALDLSTVAAALAAAPTRVVCVSWVNFSRGGRLDLAALAELCHAHGAVLVADIIQGLGVLPCDLAAWGVDAASADAHKFLLGPPGIGVAYYSPALRAQLRPIEAGWNAVPWRMEWTNLDFAWDPTARAFEGGTHNSVGIAGLGAAIDLLAAAGTGHIWAHVDQLLRHATTSLTDLGCTIISDRTDGNASAICTFTIPGLDADTAWEQLSAQGIGCSPRACGIRIAPHGYTTADDIDALVAAVAAL